MRANSFFFTKHFLVFAFVLSIRNANAQGGICPPNLDFEKGDFTGWQCYRGLVIATPDGENELQLNPTAPLGVHTMITAGSGGADHFGGFPVSCPNGSRHSVKLGDIYGGHQAEAITYTFTVPASGQFSITYNYAVVLNNPHHLENEQPRFRARVIDVVSGSEIDCVSFDFVASSSLPGFKISPVDPDVIYKDWTPVTIDLSDYAGKTIRLEFITSDCTKNIHFGYAYVDVNSNCSNTFAAASLCEGDPFLTLTASYGFAHYAWYANNDYSIQVADTQTYYINPAPPASTTYAVIVTPYPGYGCVDTFYAPMTRVSKPEPAAGTDREVWCNQTIQLGGPPNISYSYLWTPADNLNNPTAADPTLINYIYTPKRFKLSVTDNKTGCVTKDSVLITPINCFLFVP
ncbi:MAG: hypothetical protein KDB99_14510, partial [Chitinophagaceae bacterium]|nr:hypothetical protein [Chitinophagaceae bacterium]